MNIKDYLHLYLGCDIQLKDGSIEKLKTVDSEISIVNMGWGNAQGADEVSPILRPLSDITEDELKLCHIYSSVEHAKICWKERFLSPLIKPKDVVYLLSKHFDLFGLIDAGLAIDVTTLKQTA
jgi:hypothetical protein